MTVVPCWLGFAARAFRIVMPLALAIVAVLWIWWPLGVALGAVALYMLLIHRCPEMRCTRIPGAMSAPCDGTAILDPSTTDDRKRIVVTPRGFDCRILRAPLGGRVQSAELTAHGQHIVIDNEFSICKLKIEGGWRLLGWPSRVQKGTDVDAGEALGLVPFGARVVFEYPSYATTKITSGQEVRGGKTVMAIAHEDDLRRGRVVSRCDSDIFSLAETG